MIASGRQLVWQEQARPWLRQVPLSHAVLVVSASPSPHTPLIACRRHVVARDMMHPSPSPRLDGPLRKSSSARSIWAPVAALFRAQGSKLRQRCSESIPSDWCAAMARSARSTAHPWWNLWHSVLGYISPLNHSFSYIHVTSVSSSEASLLPSLVMNLRQIHFSRYYTKIFQSSNAHKIRLQHLANPSKWSSMLDILFEHFFL